MEAPINTPSSFGIDDAMQDHILDSTRWAKYLASVGFALCVLIAIISTYVGVSSFTRHFGAGNGISSLDPAIWTAAFYLVVAILYFIPCLFLYKFSIKTQGALENEEQKKLLSGFRQLNRFFKFVGICTMLFFFLLAFATVVLGIRTI